MAKVVITKSYAQLRNVGNYENIRIETTLSKELDDPTVKEITEMSDKLVALAKKLNDKDIENYTRK